MSTAAISGIQRLNSSENRCETDRVTSVELHRNRRTLYFSDGTMEVDTDNEETNDLPDSRNTRTVEFQNTFSFLSRLRNNCYRVGSSVLAGIDYIGEELADMFGITSKPSNVNSIDFHKQSTSIVNPEEGAKTHNNNRHEAFAQP